MTYKRRSRLPAEAYVQGILEGNKVKLSQSITLVESTLDEDQVLAGQILNSVLPYCDRALRIGITGVPGVGKSTFIEHFGKYLTGLGKKVAVLAIDPTSQKTKGSILGDKTRMETLAHDPLAYIRPSATGTALGGVGDKTREAMRLCEAAGYEVVIVETVGVGQSETAVREMVDFFLLLMLAGAGDELQGIKKGIMEMADAIAINKTDGENKKAAAKAKNEYRNALQLMAKHAAGWSPQVLTCSAIENDGLDEIWELMQTYEVQMKKDGYFYENRQRQNLHWMNTIINHRLKQHFYQDEQVMKILPELEKAVLTGETPALNAANLLLSAYLKPQQ